MGPIAPDEKLIAETDIDFRDDGGDGRLGLFRSRFPVDARGLRGAGFLATVFFTVAVFFNAFFGAVVNLFFKDLLLMMLCILFENHFSVLQLIVD